MAEKNSYYEVLVHKLFEGTITPEEKEELENWYRETPDSSVIISSSLAKDEDELRRLLLQKTREKAGIDETKTGNRRGFVRVAAAVIFVLMGTAGYFWIKNNTTAPLDDDNKIVTSAREDEILPGGNKAILTLSDGRKIVLDSLREGEISQEGDIIVLKLQDGTIAYDGDQSTSKNVEYNTITTPRGGQYQIVLSDGTKVWLNAQSSLKYPTSFNGNERKIELKGEGYFEVAHRDNQPFVVSVNGMEVKVLGTHFNINGYGDDNKTVTTLVEGKVELNAEGNTTIMRPGDQATLNDHGDVQVQKVDVETAVAWKDGYFDFQGKRLHEVMRQIARWYDVEIVYKGQQPDIKFGGKMERALTLDAVLQILELSKVKFKVEKGRKLIVE